MRNALTVPVVRLPHGVDLPLPIHASALAAGVDLHAAIPAPLTLRPGQRAVVPTALALALPNGYEGQVRPRSGLAAKNGVTVLNTPGTIDADYRGEVKVILINLGDIPFVIERGMRIAQMVVAPVTQIAWDEMDDLPASARGDAGLGSTGSRLSRKTENHNTF